MIMLKQAVHFGAGNIGRGFIGALFSESGYHVTFVDVAEAIIDKLNEEKKYHVKLAQKQPESITIKNVSGVNNMKDEAGVLEAIKNATYLTTAIGPNILPRIAPIIAKGIAERIQATDEKLYVIACENQIGATDILKTHIWNHLDDETKEKIEGTVFFFNSAVDRIVPIQEGDSLDVLVEPYYEWVVETTESIPPITGMTIVENLAPFIERKLFTVNTGHAVIAYLGSLAGKSTIDETLAEKYHRLATARHGLGEYKAAVECFSEALAHDAACVDALEGRAKSYDKLGERDKADADRSATQRLNAERANRSRN